MLVALVNPLATSAARNDIVIDVGPVPVSTAVVGVVATEVGLEEDFAGALQARRVLPRATARTPADARNASPAVDRRVSRWWGIAHRGYRPDSAHGCQPQHRGHFHRGGRISPSCTTVTASFPSLVNTEPVANARPLAALGVSCA